MTKSVLFKKKITRALSITKTGLNSEHQKKIFYEILKYYFVRMSVFVIEWVNEFVSY